MKPTSRPYRNSDYWRMRECLRELFLLNGRVERNWHVARLDYSRRQVTRPRPTLSIPR